MRIDDAGSAGPPQTRGGSLAHDAELAAQEAQRAAAEAARLAASQNAQTGQAKGALQRAMELLRKAQTALSEAKKKASPAELKGAEEALAKAAASAQQAAVSLRYGSAFEPAARQAPAAQINPSALSIPPGGAQAAAVGTTPSGQAPTPGYAQEQAAKDAADIYSATQGGLTGWGTDEEKLFKALDNRSPADIALIRQSFKEHYNLDLDKSIREELSGDDLARANAILSGDKGTAAASAFKKETGWFGDQEGSLKALAAASPQERHAIVQSFQQMYAKDYPDVKASTPEEFMQKALGSSLNDSQKSQLKNLLATTQAGTPAEVAQLEAGAARAKAKDALAGFWGADSQKVFDTLKDLPPAQKQLLLQDTAFQADLKGKLSKEDYTRAQALLQGNQAAASAAQIDSARQGWFGADKSGIIDTLKNTKPEALPALKAEYQKQTNRSLEDEVKSWGGADSQVALSYLNPPADGDKAGQARANAQRLHRAMDGVGTDEAALREILGAKSKAELNDINAAYRQLYQRDLRSDLSSELSGRDKFEIVDQMFDLGAIDPKAPNAAQQRLDRVKAQRQFEQSAGLGLMDGIQHLTKGESDADRLDRNISASEAAIASGDTQAANRRLGYASDDVKALQETKDSAADMASTAAVVVVTTGAVIATGGAATPLAIAGYAALGATARVGTQYAFKGDSLGSEGLLQQGALGMLEGATAAIPVPKGLGGAAVQGTEQVAERTALQRLGNAAAYGAWSGGVQGSATGAADQAMQSETWRNGVLPGFAQVGRRAVTDGAIGLAFGAGGGAAMDGLMQGASRLARPREVPVVRNTDLAGDTTLVRYDNGRVHIQAGPRATAENIQAHLETAKALQKYEGPLGRLRRLRDGVDQAITGRPGYGTQGFESQLEVKKLTGLREQLEKTRAGIEERIRVTAGKADPATAAERAAIQKDIANLEAQLALHQAQLGSLDPARGFVAALDDSTAHVFAGHLDGLNTIEKGLAIHFSDNPNLSKVIDRSAELNSAGRLTGVDEWIAAAAKSAGNPQALGQRMAELNQAIAAAEKLPAGQRLRLGAPADGLAAVTSTAETTVRRLGNSGAVDMRAYVPTTLDGKSIRVGGQRTLSMEAGWRQELRDLGLKDPTKNYLYVLRDEQGTVLKVGKTAGRAIEGRLGPYANAMNYGGKKIMLDICEVGLPQGMTLDALEKATRTRMLPDAKASLRAGEKVLPWDHSQELNRRGVGTPGVTTREMRRNGEYWNPGTGELVAPAKGGPALTDFASSRRELRRTVNDVQQAISQPGATSQSVARELGMPEQQLKDLLDFLGLTIG